MRHPGFSLYQNWTGTRCRHFVNGRAGEPLVILSIAPARASQDLESCNLPHLCAVMNQSASAEARSRRLDCASRAQGSAQRLSVY